MRLLAITGGIIALCFLDASPSLAQLDNGNITGRVSDPSGMVVAGAQVTVTQTEMNFENLAQTNEEGIYRVVNLRPGPYRVTIAAPGFKKLVRESLVLQMGATMAINAQLEVGSVTESVEVSAAAPLLESETSATGTVLKGDYFYRLPLLQRWAKSTLMFTPGLTFSGNANPGAFGTFHINGLANRDIGIFEDGQLGTNGDGLSVETIANTIEDIKVLTGTLPAEYGHSAGGALSVVKKSGTNQIHGIASNFGRVRRMQHRRFFDKYRLSQIQPGFDKAPGVLFQQPDFNINGPVVIPKIYDGRNKTFFMFAWQKIIEKQVKQATMTVPTPAQLEGDFTFGGIGQAIYDPRTTRQDAAGNWLRDVFPGNVIQKSSWSPVAKKIIDMKPYRPPNVPGSMTTTGPANNLQTGVAQVAFYPNYSWRVDQQFGPNFKVYGTWTFNQRFYRLPAYSIANPVFDGTLNKSITRQNTISSGGTWVISPTWVTDMRAGYYRYDTNNASIAYQADYAGMLGIAGLSKDAMPQIWPGGFSEGLNVGGPSRNLRENITVKDDTSTVRGSHAFKFGYELLRYRENNWSIGNPAGSYSYTGSSGLRTNGTGLPNTGNTFAGFLTGAISSVSFSRQIVNSLPQLWQHSWYIQDDWKVTPSLTLNIGLRYNIETPVKNRDGKISIFDPAAPDNSQYTNYTCNNCKGSYKHPDGASPYRMQRTRFDPRFGLAWHPLRRLVIRSGFALSHTDMRTSYLNLSELTSESTSISQAPGNPTPLFYLQNGVPSFTYPARRADGSVPYVGNAGGRSATVLDPNLKPPYTMTWNLGVQTELSANYMLEVQYRGSAQVKMLGSFDLNTLPWAKIPNPSGSGWLDLDDPANATYRNTWLNNTQVSRPWNNWGSINFAGNTGHMYHHEGTVKIEKRYSKGVNFQAFYTLGKTLANSGDGNPYLDGRLLKTRVSYDQRHYFAGTVTYELPVGKGRRFMNRGGWLDYAFGGFDVVGTYIINSGQPSGVSISGAGTQNYPSYMPRYGNVILLKRPALRDNWQDLGGDRFNQNNQNSLLDCGFDGSFVVGKGNSCMTFVPSFSRGNDNAYVFDKQRLIATTVSASKEVPIKERLKFQFRFDFQNPFHWFNWGGPNTGLNISSLSNSKSFGTTTPSAEQTQVSMGGQPLINLTLALKW